MGTNEMENDGCVLHQTHTKDSYPREETERDTERMSSNQEDSSWKSHRYILKNGIDIALDG